MITLRSMQVFGDAVQVVIRPTEDGYSCEFDSQRNRGDSRRDLNTIGYGETVADAMRAYARQCHALESSGADLYSHDSAMQ